MNRLRLLAWSIAAALGVARGLIGYSKPTYWAPTTTLDWASVVTFSCFLVAAAAALALLAVELRPLSRRPIEIAAAGAAVAGIASGFEDGIGVSLFGYAFSAGVAVMVAGLLVGGTALTAPRSGARRIGLLLLANVAALAVAFDTLGLVVFGSTCLVVRTPYCVAPSVASTSSATTPSSVVSDVSASGASVAAISSFPTSPPAARCAAASAFLSRLRSRFSLTACSRARFAIVCGLFEAMRLLGSDGKNGSCQASTAGQLP